MRFKFDIQSWLILAAAAGFIYGEATRGDLGLPHGIMAGLAVLSFCMWSFERKRG